MGVIRLAQGLIEKHRFSSHACYRKQMLPKTKPTLLNLEGSVNVTLNLKLLKLVFYQESP
jgi:hypothetical protein